MGLPPSKITLDLDAYNKAVPHPTGGSAMSQQFAKKVDENRRRKLEEERLAAIRAQNRADSQIDRQVGNQVQDSGISEQRFARERSVVPEPTFNANRKVVGGTASGVTPPGPLGLAVKGGADLWELAIKPGVAQALTHQEGITRTLSSLSPVMALANANGAVSDNSVAPPEFHEEVRRQQELAQEKQKQATNPLQWMLDEFEEQIIAPTVALGLTKEDFPEFEINVPLKEDPWMINHYDVMMEIADFTNYTGIGLASVGKLPSISKTTTVVKLAVTAEGVRGATLVAKTSSELLAAVKAGTTSWNGKLGAWVDHTVSDEILRTSNYDFPRSLPDEIPFGPLAEAGASTKPKDARASARTFRFDDPMGASLSFQGRKVSLGEMVDAGFKLEGPGGVIMDIRPWDKVIFERPQFLDMLGDGSDDALEFVMDANHDISVTRQTRQGIGKGLVPYSGKNINVASGRKIFVDRLAFERRKKTGAQFSSEEFEAIDQFIKLLPDEYFDNVGLSLRRKGRRDHSIVGGREVLPDPDEAFENVIGLYEEIPDPLITIYTKKIEFAEQRGVLTGDANMFVSTIVHEVAHHLERLIGDVEYRKLIDVYTTQKAAWESVPKRPFDLERKELQMQALYGVGYKVGGVAPRDYRFKTFHEWFAETMSDKALRDLFPEATRQTANSLAEKLKLLAVAMYRKLKKSNPDIAEQVYQDLVLGKYKGEQLIKDYNRADDIKNFLDDKPKFDPDVKVTWNNAETAARNAAGTGMKINGKPAPSAGDGVRVWGGDDDWTLIYGTSKIEASSDGMLDLAKEPHRMVSSSNLASEKLLRNYIRAGVRGTLDEIVVIIPTDGTSVLPPTMLKQFGFEDLGVSKYNTRSQFDPRPNEEYMGATFVLRNISGTTFKAPRGVGRAIDRLPAYEGEAFRTPSGFSQDRGTTAGDVVRYERDELGNVETFSNVTDDILRELDQYPAEDIVWVGRNREVAARYDSGEGMENVAQSVAGGRVIADIPDGTLVLRPGAKKKTTPATSTATAKKALSIKELWGKLPTNNFSPASVNKWVADDMPYSPEQTVQASFKDEFFANYGIELTPNDELVWKHINSMPRKVDGTVDLGAMMDIRKQVEALAKLDPNTGKPMIGANGKPIMMGDTLEDSLTATMELIVRKEKTASGLRSAFNLNQLFAMDDAIAKTLDDAGNTTYSQTLKGLGSIPKIKDLVNMTVRERFPRALQIAAIKHDAFISNFQSAISGEFFRLHKKFDAVLRGTTFDIIEPKIPVKGQKGVMQNGTVRTAFDVINKNVEAGKYTSEQAHAMRLSIMFQNPTAFNLARDSQKRLIKRLSNILDDNLRLEVWSGAFRGADEATASVIDKNYLPAIWKFDDDLLDAEGLLTDAGFKKIFGTTQFFEKTRTFPDIASAIGIMEKRGISMRLADEIQNPLDLIGARLMAGARLMGDKHLNDMVAEAVAKETVTPTQKKAFMSILGGGSGEVGDYTTKALDSLINMTLAGPIRMVRFSMDLGVLGVQAAPSANYLIANPQKTLLMAEQAIKYFARPDGFRQWTAAHPETWARAQRAGLKVGQEILQKDLGGDWIEQLIRLKKEFPFMEKATHYNMPAGVPLIGGKAVYNPIKLINEAQFSRVMAIIKLMSFEMESDILFSDSIWNQAQRSIYGMKTVGPNLPVVGKIIPAPRGSVKQVSSRLEADIVAAHATNERFGGMGNARALQSKGFRKLLTPLMLTPDFAQATMATLARTLVTPTTPEATIARGFWIRSIAVTTMLGIALQEAFGGEFHWKDPSDPNYQRWENPWGDVINLLGRFGTHGKLVMGTALDVKDLFSGDAPRNSDNKFDLTLTNTYARWGRFINGRVSAPIELTQRLKTQKDYQGDPFWDADMEPHIKDYAIYLASHAFVPISAVQIMEDRKRNELTWSRAIYSFTGVAQFPYDQVRADGKVALELALTQEIVENNPVGPELAKQLAHEAVTERNPKFGRVRPDVIIDRRTGLPLDISMKAVYRTMAVHMEYFTEEGLVDVDRARRLGEEEKLTPKERKQHEEDMQEQYFGQIAVNSEAKLNVGRQIETEYGPGKEYPTLQSALRAIGSMNSGFSQSNRLLQSTYGETVDRLRDKRISPTEREVVFDVIRTVLDETVNEDGTVDHWNRTRRMDALEAQDPDMVEKFFESDVNRDEAQLVRTWRQAVNTASKFYEIPVKVLSEREYKQWREYTASTNNEFDTTAYQNRVGDKEYVANNALDIRVTLAKNSALTELDPNDIVEMEIALWFLDGRTPMNEKTRDLLKYHTGSEIATATEFEQSMDIETLLDTLGREPG